MAHVESAVGRAVIETLDRGALEYAREQMIRSHVERIQSCRSLPIIVALIASVGALFACLAVGPRLPTDAARLAFAIVVAFLSSIGVVVAITHWYVTPRATALTVQLDRMRTRDKRLAAAYDRLCTEDPTIERSLDWWRAHAAWSEQRAIARARQGEDASAR